MKQTIYEERLQAIALLQAGHQVNVVAQQLKRTPQWVRKVKRRYQQDGVKGLADRSRAPKKSGNRLPTQIREAIILARFKLEASAQAGDGLKYIGGQAIRTSLERQQVKPLPSVSTIERVLRQVGMTRPKQDSVKAEVHYPHLQPQQAHQLVQVDIVPHYLEGGARVPCFNGIDVVSRYVTGQAFAQRRSVDATTFLLHLWQTIGIPHYTQLDNEGCFSGGTTHPYVLGRVVRLALQVGTELVFSPIYHPQSNGFVERFHQEYNKHVWDDTYLADFSAVNQQGEHFFDLYNQSGHHSRLHGQTPTALHFHTQPNLLAADFALDSEDDLPLTVGKVHFMRRVQADGTVRVLNVNWSVPAQPDTGVWVTLTIRLEATLLSIYDAAPDAHARTCLTTHPFPLKEKVNPLPGDVQDTVNQPDTPTVGGEVADSTQATSARPMLLVDSFFKKIFYSAQNKLVRAFFRTDQLVE